ncbi:MAG: hypothetical protein K2L80_07990, partial [Muribaculaceae bacterium]|nr:hypothetical protein [Muribaculaceae bacterium]
LTSEYVLPEPIVADNWKSMFEIPASVFKGLTDTSVIRFVFSECGVEGQAQIVYKADDANWTWTQLSDYENFKGKDEYLLPMSAWEDPADAAAGLKAHGMILKGKEFTLDKIEIYNIKGTVDPIKKLKVTYTWEPTAPMVCDKAWSTEVAIPAAAFKTLTDVSTIRFGFIDCEGGQIQIATKTADGAYTWTQLNDYTDIMAGIAEITIAEGADEAGCTAAELVQMISSNGIILKGQKFSLVKVEILNPEGTVVEKPEELEVVDTWTATSPMVITSWSSTELEIPAAAFVKATEKSTFRLHFTDCAGGQVQVVYKADDNDWTWTPMNDYGDIADNQFEISLADGAKNADQTTAHALAGLQAHGMYLKGQKFTFTSIDILNPKGTSGVGNIAVETPAIDWNAPVEVYTTSGVRVSEMTPGQLYIVRQGTNVAKVVK